MRSRESRLPWHEVRPRPGTLGYALGIERYHLRPTDRRPIEGMVMNEQRPLSGVGFVMIVVSSEECAACRIEQCAADHRDGPSVIFIAGLMHAILQFVQAESPLLCSRHGELLFTRLSAHTKMTYTPMGQGGDA